MYLFSAMGMLATLSRLLERENGEHRETREEQKDAGLQTRGKTARDTSSSEGVVSSGQTLGASWRRRAGAGLSGNGNQELGCSEKQLDFPTCLHS